MKLNVDQITTIYMDLASDESRRVSMLVASEKRGGASPMELAMRTIACTTERWQLVSAVTVAGVHKGWMTVDQAMRPRAFDWVDLLQTAEADPGMYAHLSGVYQQISGDPLKPKLLEDVKDGLEGLEQDVIVLMGACEGACSIAYPDGGPQWEGCVTRCRGGR